MATGYRTHDENGVVNPLSQLSDEQLEAIGKEFDELHDEVRADLGDRDARYINGIISLQRRLALIGRVELFASRAKPAWWVGMATSSTAKILENMEIGHNVMHGQWDWMNHPVINSQAWDWDTASTKEAWKHSHNYVHHTFTNILGKDKDLGYEIMRIDPHQKWHPVYLLQPFYNVLLMLVFEWGVVVHDLDIDAIRSGDEQPGGRYVRQLIGAANIEGSPMFHVMSGNLGYQVEHHLYPDMPSSRYGEIAPRVREICKRYGLPYNTGPFGKQWGTVQRTILRLAFPGGKPRRKPGPWTGETFISEGERELATAADAARSSD